MPTPRRLWPYLAVLIALLAVAALYLQPDFMRALADQLWACF